VLVAAVVAGGLVLLHRWDPGRGGDFDQLWAAARAVLDGGDPYREAASRWPWPLYYPMPAVLLALPFALVPVEIARVLFASLSAGLLAFAVTKEHWWRLGIVLSGAMFYAVIVQQMNPLLVAVAFLPRLAGLLVVKPPSGLALWLAYPSRSAVVGGLALLAVSFVVNPAWLQGWWAAVGDAPHITAPVLMPGGAVVLLAVIRWRDPSARLLLALGFVPQNILPHETLALLTIPRSAREMALLAMTSWGSLLYMGYAQRPEPSIHLLIATAWPGLLVGTYLPALLLVIYRRRASAGGSLANSPRLCHQHKESGARRSV